MSHKEKHITSVTEIFGAEYLDSNSICIIMILLLLPPNGPKNQRQLNISKAKQSNIQILGQNIVACRRKFCLPSNQGNSDQS